MNKKGQIQQPMEQPYQKIHPVLIIGVVMYVLSVVGGLFDFLAGPIQTFFQYGGILTILIGAILSFLK